MSNNNTFDFDVPESFMNQDVTVSYAIPIPGKSTLGGASINFPGVSGKLTGNVPGALILETTDLNGNTGVILVPKVQCQGISMSKKKSEIVIS